MNKNTIQIELTTEEFDFLKNMAQDAAFELYGFQQIRYLDKKLAKKAEIAKDLEKSLDAAQLISPAV